MSYRRTAGASWLPDELRGRVAALLSEHLGAPVQVVHGAPIAEGWSASSGAHWPWITRCIVESGAGARQSVIVKTSRPEDHVRAGLARLHTERAALEFLALVGSDAGPRLLAADAKIGILILEDLGAGPALEDVLTGRDARKAEAALVSFAKALGRMHGMTVGHTVTYDRMRRSFGEEGSNSDRVSILGTDVEASWHELQRLVTDRPHLPDPVGVEADVDEVLYTLRDPGSFLAFSNGDACPANSRLTDSGVRFLDFEHAAFRHALLDASALRFPFPACPCWSRLPGTVSRHAENAYRRELAPFCRDILDDIMYRRGMAVACAAWTIVRMTRLRKLEDRDTPHPMGFSRRGQLLDTISTAIDSARESGNLVFLTNWLASVHDALSECWPDVSPVQSVYPAFRVES